MHKARSVLSVKEKVGWVAGAWHSFAAPVTERAKRQPGSGKADGSRCRLHSLVLCALLDACKWHKKQRLQSVSHACAKIFLPHVEPPSTLHRQHREDCVTLSQADQLFDLYCRIRVAVPRVLFPRRRMGGAVRGHICQHSGRAYHSKMRCLMVYAFIGYGPAQLD